MNLQDLMAPLLGALQRHAQDGVTGRWASLKLCSLLFFGSMLYGCSQEGLTAHWCMRKYVNSGPGAHVLYVLLLLLVQQLVVMLLRSVCLSSDRMSQEDAAALTAGKRQLGQGVEDG